MTIGGHTVDHPVLSRLTVERQRHEIETCAARIRAETGRPMEYFAYPVGARWAFDAETHACLEAAGVRRAFSYYGGHAEPGSPRLDTPRVAMEPYVEMPDLAAMLCLPQVFCRPDRA
jgi:peptidoglycan/xylan/chitin deacetylase (PgdA/CDA1 family)